MLKSPFDWRSWRLGFVEAQRRGKRECGRGAGGVVVGEVGGHRWDTDEDGVVFTIDVIAILGVFPNGQAHVGIRPMPTCADDPPIAKRVAFVAAERGDVVEAAHRTFYLLRDVERGFAADLVGDEVEVGHSERMTKVMSSKPSTKAIGQSSSM